MSDDKIYCGFKAKNGKPLYTYIAIGSNHETLFKSDGEEKEEAKRKRVNFRVPVKSEFHTLLDGYLQMLDAMFNSIPFIMTMLPALRAAIVKIDLFDEVQRIGKKMQSDEDAIIYEVDFHEMPRLLNDVEKLNSIQEFQAVAPRMFLTGLVAAYDGFLGALLRHVFLIRPEIISASEKKMTFAEIARMGSIDVAKEYIVERETESILRGSHLDQLDSLKKLFSIDIASEFDKYREFLEICERRNLFTHNNGIATQGYVEFCGKHQIDCKNAIVGKELEVSQDYMFDALGVFYELGVKLTHVLWRKFDKTTQEEADQSLNDIGFDLIVHHRYRLAQRVLGFANTLRSHVNERVRLMMVVNLANALRLNGQCEEALEILKGEDWSATSPEFRLSVAAVSGEFDEAANLMQEIGPNGNVGKSECRNWPVFDGFRDSAQFRDAYNRVFGEQFDEIPAQIEMHESESVGD